MTNFSQSAIVAERTWPVRALSLLFLLQAASLVGLGFSYFVAGDPQTDFRSLIAPDFNAVSTRDQVQIMVNFALIPLAVVVLVATVGFYKRWDITWLYAMLAQGLILAVVLIQYWYGDPNYFLMTFSTFLVLYLNYANAQANLLTKSLEAEDLGSHD
ncbi:MAG: hypothetical protein AAF629_34800 [Chloroflexota bacterium]